MILNKFLERTEYSSYEDLYQNFKLTIPDNFNFAYDVVDEYAKTEPKREALVWCDDNDESHIFTFKDLSVASQRTANFLVEKGIKKGDKVLMPKYGGTEIKLDGKTYQIMREEDILGIIG